MFTPLYCLSVTLLFHSLSVESPEAWRQISQSFVFFHLSIKVNSFPFWFIHVNACAPWFLLISLHASSIQMMKIGQIQGGGMSSMLTEPKLPVVKKRPRRGWGRLAKAKWVCHWLGERKKPGDPCGQRLTPEAADKFGENCSQWGCWDILWNCDCCPLFHIHLCWTDFYCQE